MSEDSRLGAGPVSCAPGLYSHLHPWCGQWAPYYFHETYSSRVSCLNWWHLCLPIGSHQEPKWEWSLILSLLSYSSPNPVTKPVSSTSKNISFIHSTVPPWLPPFLTWSLHRNLYSSRDRPTADPSPPALAPLLRPCLCLEIMWYFSPPIAVLPQNASPCPSYPQPIPLAWTTAAHPSTCIIMNGCYDNRIAHKLWQFEVLFMFWWADWHACVCVCACRYIYE